MPICLLLILSKLFCRKFKSLSITFFSSFFDVILDFLIGDGIGICFLPDPIDCVAGNSELDDAFDLILEGRFEFSVDKFGRFYGEELEYFGDHIFSFI